MQIKEFIYSDKRRKLLVLEDSATNLKGVEFTLIPETLGEDGKPLAEELQERTKVQKLVESMSVGENGKLSESDYALIKPYMKYFHNYSKAKIVTLPKEESK